MSDARKENAFKFDLLAVHSEEEHIHQDTELIYVLNGTVNVKLDAEKYQLSNDDIIVINMNKRHSLLFGEDTLVFRIHIPYTVLNRYVDQDYIMFWCNTTLDDNEYYHSLRTYLCQMLVYIVKDPEMPSPITDSYFYELLGCLFSQFRVDSNDERFKQDQDKHDKRMNEIISYIENNYSQNISLSDLANRLHLTYSYLSRCFKTMFGTNFLEYVNKVRLHHAAEDLLYTDKSITRIALDNGFVNSSGLSKIFKDTYDMTPTAYKKVMRSKLFWKTPSDDNRINKRDFLYKQALNYIAEKEIEQRWPHNLKRHLVQADGSRKEPYKKNWMELINIGRASDLLKAKVQEQTLILRDDIGFRYVRLWGLFQSDMELRLEHQTDILNFDRIDEVLDFLVYNNLLPFIELGDKPIQIARNTTDDVMLDEGPPAFLRLSEYQFLLTRFFQHIISRYRIDQVRQWRFECWYDERTERQVEPVSFFQIFNVTCKVIRSLLPNAVIGGCGMKINDVEMEDFLNTWKEQPSQPDFFSVLAYPYDPIAPKKGKYTYASYTHLLNDSKFIKHQVMHVKKLLRAADMKIPLYVTEWNCTISSRNYINDTCHKGTYILKNVVDMLGEVDIMGYFCGLDLVTTYYDSQNILNGCTGLLTKDNINKPAYYAFRFLHRMGSYLVEAGKNYLITTNGHFSYYIICYNYQTLDNRYYQKSENLHTIREISTFSTGGTPLHMDFQLDNLPTDKYFIKTFTISPHYGSVLNEWIRLNMITNMSKEDIEYLKRICTPHMTIQEMKTVEGTLRFELKLEPEEFTLVHIYHQY